jgi:hypothetical protein
VIPVRWLLALCFTASVSAQSVQVWQAREPEPQAAPEVEEDASSAAAATPSPANHTDDEAASLRKSNEGVTQMGLEIDQNLLKLQAALNNGVSTADILRDKKMRETLKLAFKNNPMTQMPREELRPMLEAQLKGSPWEKVTQRFPKILDFFMDFMRHPSALSSLIGILDRPRAMKNCGIASLVSMVLIILLRQKVIGPRTRFFKRLGLQLFFSTLFLSVSGMIFWFTFHEEFDPTWGVFKQTFL